MKPLISYNQLLSSYTSKPHGIKALDPYKKWFPIYPSIRLAGIIADLMGDGHIQGKPKYRIDYTSKYIEELERFNQEIYSLFNITGKIRPCTTNKYITYNIRINNKPCARLLELLKVPTGSKVQKSFRIPQWILQNPYYFARFINRLLSCEGCVDLYSKCIEISMFKSIEYIEDGLLFFKDIKKYLEYHFQIQTTNPFLTKRINQRKDGIQTQGIRLKIKKKDSVLKFIERIGIEDTKKEKRLQELKKQFTQYLLH